MQVIGLIPRFAAGSKVAQAEKDGLPTDSIPGADSADDEDIMKGMARLFAEVGEAFTPMIASGGPHSLTFSLGIGNLGLSRLTSKE